MIRPKDIRLFACLRQNGRETITEISKKTKIPISTVYDRLRHHKNTNVIQKFSVLLDFTKFGYLAKATILFKVCKTDKKRMLDYLRAHQNVNTIYRINNGYDYMAEVIFCNIKDLEEFLEALDEEFKIKHREVHYIIDDLKREEFIPMTAEI